MLGVLAVCGCFAACPSLHAAAAPRTEVAGGRALEAPGEAPWSVLTRQVGGTGSAQCSGSIIDATHVLTAAHCAFEESGTLFPLAGYHVHAGVSHLGVSGEEQTRAVASIRIGPNYKPLGGGGADVALLTLETPFNFGGAGVQPIALAALGAQPAPGSLGRIVGWGQVQEGIADNFEHELTQAVLHQRDCLGGSASILCASSPVGGTCHGDSGGGLIAGTPPVLVGVLSVGVGLPQCAAAARTGYVSVASPEIRLWLAGESEPPLAPRTTVSAGMRGIFSAGSQVTCLAPTWQNAVTVTAAFFRADSGEDLQRGQSTYSPSAADVGHPIACASVAESAGGVTESAPSAAVTVTSPRTASAPTTAVPPTASYGRSRDLVEVTSRSYRRGRWRVRLQASALLGQSIEARWRAPNCRGCSSVVHLKARRRTLIWSPLLPRGVPARLVLKFPALTIGSVDYAASRLIVEL